MRTGNKETRLFFAAFLATAALYGCGGSDSSSSDAAKQEEPARAATETAAMDSSALPPGGYAPKLTMPKKRPDHIEVPLAESFLNAATVPAADDVNVPVYPGAKIMSTMAAGQIRSSSGDGKSLAGMSLLIPDDLETALAFYKAQLGGWQYRDVYGVHMFWNGPEGSNPLDISAGYSTISLSELSADSVQRLLWPEMQTKVDMMYDKPGS